MSEVMVLHEPSCVRIIHIPDETTLHRIALDVVKARHAAGYYSTPVEPTPPGYHSNSIRTLPEALKQIGKNILSKYRTDFTEYEERMVQHRLLLTAIETNDGAAAWSFLQGRTKRISEDIEIIPLETKYEMPT